MQIKNSNIYTPHFKAKIPLNNRELLKNTHLFSQSTPLDSMFNENLIVKNLDNLSVFVKNNILCKYFNAPKTIAGKLMANFQKKVILYSRILADRIFLMSNKHAINKINDSFIKIHPDSAEYIEELARMGGTVKNKYIIANTEDKTLDKIAQSDNSTIFVLNHPNYHKDKFIYAFLSSTLSKMYTANGKQAKCPRPKILVSRNMLKIVHPKIGNVYRKLGLVEVDASLHKKDRAFNAVSIKNLMTEFTKDKANIFIFPEGNNSAYQFKPLEDRLQPGVASFIKEAVKHKNSVRVVPIGIDYSKKQKGSLGRIYIGKPLYFKNSKDGITYTEGVERRRIRTISRKQASSRILDTLCRNLKYNIEKAKRS